MPVDVNVDNASFLLFIFLEQGHFHFFNPFHANGLFLYPQKSSGSLMFLAGIEEDHWPKLVNSSVALSFRKLLRDDVN